MASHKTKSKTWMEMSARELEAATAEYDRKLPAAAPMSAAVKAKRDRIAARLRGRARAERKAAAANGPGRGRPRVGKGAARLNVTVERGLLARADAFAKAEGMSRAEMIAIGLEAVIAGEAGVRRRSHGRNGKR